MEKDGKIMENIGNQTEIIIGRPPYYLATSKKEGVQ